jgi:hypothetical protein
MLGKGILSIIQGIKKTLFLILKILKKLEIFRKELLLIIKNFKKIIF